MAEINAKIIQALKSLPAAKLLIIDILNQVTGPDGEINTEMVRDRQKEINLANAEARIYAKATMNAVIALKKLTSGAFSQDPNNAD